YLEGISFASQLLLPWIDAATESLRAAGLTRSGALEIVEALCARTMRAYVNSGPKAWNRRSATILRRALERDASRMGHLDPRLAALYTEGLRLSMSHFGVLWAHYKPATPV